MTFRKITTLLFSLLALLLAVNVAAQDDPPVVADQNDQASLQFVQNEGQFAAPVEYKILGMEYPAWLTADSLWLALVTPASFEVGRHLIEGLKNPTVVTDRSALDVFPIKPMGIREAVAKALAPN